MVSGNNDAYSATIYFSCDALSIPIKSIFNYFNLWFHILDSTYILIFLDFALEWIYMSFLQHAQGVDDNPLIQFDCKSEYPYIVGHIVELSRPHCHGLYGPEIANKD